MAGTKKDKEMSRIVVTVGDGTKLFADIVDEFAIFYAENSENVKKLYLMEKKQNNKNAKWSESKKVMVVRYPKMKRLEILSQLESELKEVEKQIQKAKKK